MNTYNYQKGRRILTTFKINHLTYTIAFKEHADLRKQQRNIDELQVVSAILALGSKRIEKYNNSDKDFAVIDKEHNITIIGTIEHQQIIVTTLINHADIWVKKGTDVINL